MNNDSWFQNLINRFDLTSNKINYHLIAYFFGALLLSLPAIYALVLALSSPANLLDYLARVAPEAQLDVNEQILQQAFGSTFSFLSDYLIWVVIGLFILNFLYQLFVIYVVTKLVLWITEVKKIIYHKKQVYNILLLVYSVKTVLDVLLIPLVGITKIDFTGLEILIALLVNGLIYYSLYRILKLLKSKKSDFKI